MLSTESLFSERIYFEAAQERIATANMLLNQSKPDYAMASYTAGVAVERLFHAYRMHAGRENLAHHSLTQIGRITIATILWMTW